MADVAIVICYLERIIAAMMSNHCAIFKIKSEASSTMEEARFTRK
jgi:hypothetical protein